MAFNKALTGTVMAAVLALILMLIAFIIPQWQSKTVEQANSDGTTTIFHSQIGMTSWQYEITQEDANGNEVSTDHFEGPLKTDGDIERTETRTNPPSTVTTTITAPASTQLYQALQVTTIITDSQKARDGVLGTGIPGFIFGIVFLVLLGTAQTGKGYTWFRPVSVLLCVLTAVMTFLGVFLYAKVLDIGYSFIIWAGFAVFMVLAGIFIILPNASPKGRYLPLACVLMALALGLVGMSTPSWYSESFETTTAGQRNVITSNAGVKAYRVLSETYDANNNVVATLEITSTFDSDTFSRHYKDATVEEEVTINKCPDTPAGGQCYFPVALENGRFKDFITGGQKALGCGIPALFACAVALGAMITLLRGASPKHAKMVAIISTFLGALLGFLGLFLYAAITSVGASFVVYAAAGFLWILASCLAFGLLNTSGGSSSPATTSAPPKTTDV